MGTEVASTEFISFNSNIITEDLYKIAEEELHENESDTIPSLDTLKELLKREKDLTPRWDDEFLLMFLRARKFNVQATFNLIKRYYTAPINFSSMFKNFNPKSCMAAVQSGIHYFLPYRSSQGCAILLSRFGKWDPKVLSCEELLKFNLMCNEMAVLNPVTQISGVVTIADMKYFSWSHLFQINISDVQCFVNTLQNCLPVRDKAIHIIHHSSIFSVLFALVKPLLNEKVKNRIFFHGDDLSSLHRHLSPEILPKDLGGKLSSLPNEDFYNSLLSHDDYFLTQQNFGYLSKMHSN